MNIAQKSSFVLNHRHLLGIEGLSRQEIVGLLDLAEEFVDLNRRIEKKQSSLRGRTLINLFFEVSTRTQASFELAGKRLGADVMNMSVGTSSMSKGETLIDTAMTRGMPQDMAAKFIEQIPLGRIGAPEDVAQAVLFLCSPAAAYITGQVLEVNGGFHMG